MSIFSNLFGKSESSNIESNSKINWVLLTHLSQLEELKVVSETKPVLIFKHSTRCSISRMALKQFENEFDLQEKIIPYFLDLITYREISNAIASEFAVVHQSPQLLLIQNGKSVYDVSHDAIDAQALKIKL